MLSKARNLRIGTMPLVVMTVTTALTGVVLINAGGQDSDSEGSLRTVAKPKKIGPYDWQDSEVFDEIRKIAGDQWAGAEITDNSKLTLYFKGSLAGRPTEAIGRARSELEKLKPDLKVEGSGDLKFSEAELIEAQKAAVKHIEKARNKFLKKAVTTYSFRTGVVTIRAQRTVVLRGADGPKSDAEKLAGQLQPPEFAANKEIKYKVDLVDDYDTMSKPQSKPSDNIVRGGGLRHSAKNKKVFCTTGFNAINKSTKKLASLTAGHCNGTDGEPEIYEQTKHVPDNPNETVMEFMWSESGAGGDFGFHEIAKDQGAAKSGSPAKDLSSTFWWDQGKTAYVERVGTMARTNVRGKRLCRFGMQTGRQCDEVENFNITLTNYSATGATTIDSLVVMKAQVGRLPKGRKLSEPGDSGGPWHKNNTAYGIHFGWIDGREAFSPVYRIPEINPGWKVMTRAEKRGFKESRTAG